MLTAVTTAPDPSTDVAHMNATGHNHMTRAAPRPQVTPATLDDKALVWLACTLITSFLICIHCVESSVLRCSYFYQSFFPSVICSANTARAAPFFFFHTFVCAPEFQTGPLEEKGKECRAEAWGSIYSPQHWAPCCYYSSVTNTVNCSADRSHLWRLSTACCR